MLGPTVSLDVETDGVNPHECGLLCVGLSDGKRTVVIWPWRPTYASKLGRYLKTRDSVICHNGIFDRTVLRRHGVPGDKVQWGDTLVAHHAFASHFPQRLDWLVSEYCFARPWKMLHGRRGDVGEAAEKGMAVEDMAAVELCKYNASDCQLTARVWKRLQSDLAPERTVYEHDLQLQEVCMSMAIRGLYVDLKRKYTLSRALRNRGRELTERMRGITGNPHFGPSRLADVKDALFNRLRSRIVAVTPTGAASTSNATLETLRGEDTKAGRFADLLLDWRGAMKVRSTYVGGEEGAPLKFDGVIGSDGRARYNWKVHGTVSGRLSCRLQSAPRYSKELTGRVREIYGAAPGNILTYWDVSQAEMRLAAYLSADPIFMQACGADVHAGNAKVVFPEIAVKGWLDGDGKKDPARGKQYRDIAKNFGFAICYGAEADRLFSTLLSQGFKVTFRAIELILAKLRAAYKVYYRWAEKNVERVRECGYMRSPIIGRIRWFGWFPKATEIYNFPVQSALADIMNERTIEIHQRLGGIGAPNGFTMQVHDAGVIEGPEKDGPRVKSLIEEVWSRPIKGLPGGDLVLPIDLKQGTRWSEF